MERFLPRPTQAEIAYRIEQAQELTTKFREGYLADLQPLKNWLVYRTEQINGRKTKPPYSPRTGRLADPTNPETWGSLEQALKALSTGFYHGIGFALPQEGWLTAIDIDHTVSGNREVRYPGLAYLRLFHSYTERSPSGLGIHILINGYLPDNVGGIKHDGIEMYSKNRYITVTLHHVTGTPKTIERRQNEIEHVYYRLHPQRLSPVTTAPQNATVVSGEGRRAPSYIQAIERGLRHDIDGLFGRLLKGDSSLWEGDAHVFASRSDADFYLARKLAYWTYGDAAQIDAVFRTPALYRPKWDEKRGKETYGQMTIRKALMKK